MESISNKTLPMPPFATSITADSHREKASYKPENLSVMAERRALALHIESIAFCQRYTSVAGMVGWDGDVWAVIVNHTDGEQSSFNVCFEPAPMYENQRMRQINQVIDVLEASPPEPRNPEEEFFPTERGFAMVRAVAKRNLAAA